MRLLLSALFLSVVLPACGGGGGGAADTVPAGPATFEGEYLIAGFGHTPGADDETFTQFGTMVRDITTGDILSDQTRYSSVAATSHSVGTISSMLSGQEFAAWAVNPTQATTGTFAPQFYVAAAGVLFDGGPPLLALLARRATSSAGLEQGSYHYLQVDYRTDLDVFETFYSYVPVGGPDQTPSTSSAIRNRQGTVGPVSFGTSYGILADGSVKDSSAHFSAAGDLAIGADESGALLRMQVLVRSAGEPDATLLPGSYQLYRLERSSIGHVLARGRLVVLADGSGTYHHDRINWEGTIFASPSQSPASLEPIAVAAGFDLTVDGTTYRGGMTTNAGMGAFACVSDGDPAGLVILIREP